MSGHKNITLLFAPILADPNRRDRVEHYRRVMVDVQRAMEAKDVDALTEIFNQGGLDDEMLAECLRNASQA